MSEDKLSAVEREVPVGSHRYRITRLSVFEQMNVAADCRDVLTALAIMKRDRPKGLTQADYDQAVQFILTSRGGMTPEVRSRVMNTCLRQITRTSGAGWQPILAADDVVQFTDIELPELVQLLYQTFDHNKFLDFFSASPSNLGQTTGENGPPSGEEKTG
jgi:hypothetical protein